MTAIPPQIAQLRATLQQALQHHQAGRLSEAERLYRSILKVRPDDPEINNALGIALKGQGKPDDAAAAFQRAVAAAPNYAPGHSNLGSILFEQDKLAEAEASYRRALALDPNMLEALNNLGLVIIERALRGKLPVVQALCRDGLWDASKLWRVDLTAQGAA
jgi:protein O-GlcNAc transferase